MEGKSNANSSKDSVLFNKSLTSVKARATGWRGGSPCDYIIDCCRTEFVCSHIDSQTPSWISIAKFNLKISPMVYDYID